MAKSSLQKQLDNRDRAEKRILAPFKEKLDRTFEVIYEVEAECDWGRMARFSPDSHFIMVVGKAVIKEGTDLNGKLLEEDFHLDVSFTIPWADLEDEESTPYQLADIAHKVNMFRDIVGPAQFMAFLRSKEGTVEKLMEGVPETNIEKLQEQAAAQEQTPADEPTIKPLDTTGFPEFLRGFDIESLTDEQRLSLVMNNLKGR